MMSDRTTLGKIVDTKSGEVLCELFGPPNAVNAKANTVEGALYAISEILARGLSIDCDDGPGGRFGDGVEYENDVFLMHPFCWCEKESCQWCSGEAPNFRHKSTGLEIRWYKWIGRDMEYNRETTSGEMSRIFREVWDSIPPVAIRKAIAEHEAENTPEALQKAKECQHAMLAAMQSMFDSMTPCWQCSKKGEPRGGLFCSGPAGCVVSTFHDESGACKNCGHINTPAETKLLKDREQKNAPRWR